jgi:hypothetical protein
MREPDFITARLEVRVPRGREPAGRPPKHKDPLWVAIRNLKTFGLKELVFAASTDTNRVSPGAASMFLHRLVRAGYLIVLRKAARGRGAIWRLKPSMDTGPRPPVVRSIRAHVLWDPNLKKFVGEPPIAKEVSP